MNARTYLIAAAVLSIIFIPLTAFADIVFLKNGKVLKVENVRLEGDQVWFIYEDMKASIPQSKVTRIESDAGVPEIPGNGEINGSGPPPHGKLLSNRIKPSDETSSAAHQQTTPAKKSLVLHKEGLDDLKWGDRAANVDGLETIQTDSALEDVSEYVRPQDALKLGDATLTSVVYAFWRDQLYTVTIWTRGQTNYQALRNAALEQFGKGIQIDRSSEGYLWSDGPTDVMLEYSEEDQYGMLWMRCKELDRKFKLSKLSGQTSYIRLLKSRN